MSLSNNPPAPPKCSPAMLRVLKNLHHGRHPWTHLYGRSMHGGAGQTERALINRGLCVVEDNKLCLTELGRYVAASAFPPLR